MNSENINKSHPSQSTASVGQSEMRDLSELKNCQQTRNEGPSIAEIQLRRRRYFEIKYNLGEHKVKIKRNHNKPNEVETPVISTIASPRYEPSTGLHRV